MSTMRIDPEFAKRMTQRERAVFLLAVGLIMGTIFVFLNGYQCADITREQAIAVRPHLESYEISYGKYRRVVEVIIRFTDHEQAYVDGSQANHDFMKKIGQISPGTQVEMLLHPHSNTVLELTHGEECLVSYEYAIREVEMERKLGIYAGIFMYLLALVGAAKLLELRRNKRK